MSRACETKIDGGHVRSEFGAEYDAYVGHTPAFRPWLRSAHENATGGART